MAETIDSVFRDFNTPGNPDSGDYEPEKPRIRALLRQMHALSGQAVTRLTLAALNAVTPPTENYMGLVLDDPDPANNGYYSRVASAWVWGRGFPDTAAVLINVGGTGNAITANTDVGVNPAEIELLILPAAPGTNAAGAVTISLNGGAPETVKNASGGDPAPGDIIDGVATMFFRFGSEWRQIFSSATGATFDHQGDWNGVTTYTEGEVVTGSNGNWFQLKDPSSLNDDPVGSVTGSWLQILSAGGVGDGAVTEPKLANPLALILNRSVATRAAMKALPPTRNALVTLMESGRQGVFELVAGSPPFADTQEGIFVVSDTVGYYWRRQWAGDVLQATWFGVKADDATDNAPAINAMIAVASAAGYRAMQLPIGVVRVGAPIVFNTGFTSFRGAGPGMTTIRRTFDTGHLFHVLSNPVGAITSNFKIGNFSVDHTVTVVTNVYCTLRIEKGDRVWIEDMSISGGFHGIWLAGCHDTFISRCVIIYGAAPDNGRIAIRVEPTSAGWTTTFGGGIYLDNVVARTAFGITPGQAGAQIGMLVQAIDGLWVSNCYFGYFKDYAVEIRNSNTQRLTGTKFSNSWFDNSEGTGVYISGTTGDSSNHKFNGCTFVGGAATPYNIRITGNATMVSVVGCSFAYVAGDNVRVDATGSCYEIVGCTFEQMDYDEAGGGAGVVVASGTDVVISNNVINGSNRGDQGILVAGGGEVVITGNRVRNCQSGISTTGTVNGYIIANNNCRGNSVSGIGDGSSGANKVVANNLV